MSHPTRQLLIDAGFELAAEGSLHRLTIDRVAFLVALHVQFHERLFERILQAVQGLEPGAERVRIGTQAYLNDCLEERGVKALLLEARSEAPISAEIQRRHASFVELEQEDFAVMG